MATVISKKEEAPPLHFTSKSPAATEAWGEKLARRLKPPRVVALVGELGAGKTRLVKGIARGLKVRSGDTVSSPTFTLVNEYRGRCPVYHIDLYRLDSPGEFCDLGYEDYFFGKGIALVEWAERIRELIPKNAVWIELKLKGPEEREIRCSSWE